MRIHWDEAAPGISQSLRALAGNYAGKGYDDQVTLESQLAQRIASIDGTRAQAALDAARMAEVNAKTGAMRRRPDVARRFGANAAGMSPDAYAGNVGNVDAGRPVVVADEAAQMSRFAKPGEQRRFESALAQQLALEGAGDWNPDQIARARGEYLGQDRTAGMVAGEVDPTAVWRAAFANRGGNRLGVDGDEMIDQLSGFLGQTEQGRSSIVADLARAGASQAQAGASRAQAAKTSTDQRRGRFSLQPTMDEDGNSTLTRVPVEGPEGPIPSVRPRPSTQLPANVRQVDADYTKDWPEFDRGSATTPSVAEYRKIVAAGLNGKTKVLSAKPGDKYTEGAVYRTPKGLMIRRAGGWEPLGGAAN